MKSKTIIKNFFLKMKYIQEMTLDLLSNEKMVECNCQNIISNMINHKISENKTELKSVLHFISIISNDHHRFSDFFSIFENIIKYFQNEIRNFFSNYELFNIFKNNKRMIYFLFKERIIVPEYSIYLIMKNDKYQDRNYPQYFYNEMKKYFINDKIEFLNEKGYNDKQIDLKKQIGENDSYIAQLIREDLIDDFVSYTNKANLCLSIEKIKPSIFETNPLLIENETSLIEYAAFFGSIQIYRFLRINNVELTSSLWLYAIHGANPEIIHLLEEDNIIPEDKSYIECYKESIKCHHNEIANYIQNNYILENDEKNSFFINLRFHNYANCLNYHISLDKLKKIEFLTSFIKYDFINIVKTLLRDSQININEKIILKN